MKKNAAGSRGFTLIELMVTLGVSALLLSIGIPGFQGLIRDNRMTTQHNQFIAGLNTARSEAVKRSVNVAMCKRNIAGNDCNNGGNWEDGWIVFTDLNDDGVVDLNETILRVHQALTGNTSLRGGPNRDRVTYNSQGFAAGGLNGIGTFTLCDDRGVTNAKGLIISPSGRARRLIDDDHNGVEDGSGNAIACPP